MPVSESWSRAGGGAHLSGSGHEGDFRGRRSAAPRPKVRDARRARGGDGSGSQADACPWPTTTPSVRGRIPRPTGS